MNFIQGITKEAISQMPREVFPGRILVVDTESGLNEALQHLSSFDEIGFDTETRPSFSKKTHYKMSLMQLSGDDVCYLIRLNKFKTMPASLELFLKNEEVKKIGLSLRDDFHGLHNLTKVAPGNFIDLQQYVVQFGIEDMSLQKIYAILFAKKISKRERLSNWEAEVLTEAQQRYAALDAWSCLRIYQFLERSK
ncbi:3'-5' exonuclease domain-containing protein 2 [Bacteroides sp. OttesenSCG-928-D19]|nr:3'-5' exonuclease domain-containing protein 2 [Bacteroides sp. OttesenSCG-928-D19]